MLFKFGTFWKTIASILGAWIFYAIWDYELTIVTLLTLIIVAMSKKTSLFS
jgi:hypothetical protein